MIKMIAAVIIAFAFICKTAVSEQCGYNVNDTTGYILSPNYPSNYGYNLDCSYIITTPEDTLVVPEIVDMHTEGGYDYVTFYDGPSTDDQQIIRYSGTYYNIPINATTNQVLVRFTADGSNSYKGFNISFTSASNGTENCGYDVTGSSGSIESPNYPSSYPANSDCYYLITTSENTAMNLQIAYFYVELNDDYVLIYDGPTDEYNIIAHLTGSISTNADTIYVSTNQALVYFHSDSSYEYTGFEINFMETEICEQEVSGPYGAVISQGYPVEPYPINQNCFYKVTTSENTEVILDIIDMDLGTHDYINIYDGPNTSSPLIGSYTGYRTNEYVYASTNEVMIYFHSDAHDENNGFYIYFTETAQICPAGGFTSNSGVLTSPFYPNTYPNNTDCYYSITTSSSTQITLHTDFLDMETSANCANDYVEVFDGSSVDATRLAKLCGQGPVNDIISSSNELFLHFHSDNLNDGEGFNILYNTDPCPENVTFYGDSGTIYSPGFPIYNYPMNARCSYYIEAPEGSKVHLTAVYTSLYSSGCYDYVYIYDGTTENSGQLAKLCGSMSIQEYQASSNEVMVTFHSDSSSSGVGFVINYVTTYY